jgi:hypothetical protein
MNSYAKLALAAAAVLVVALVGINLGPGLNTISSEASPSSSPLASPTASPSVTPSQAVAPQPPVEFTGTIACGVPVRNPTTESIELGDGIILSKNHEGAWQQTVTMSDPRLEGAIYHTYEDDVYLPEVGATDGLRVSAYTWRITNDAGTWEGRMTSATFADGLPVGEPPGVLVGSGGYEGLSAMFEVTEEREQGCVIDVRGIIFAGAPVPEPYVVE